MKKCLRKGIKHSNEALTNTATTSEQRDCMTKVARKEKGSNPQTNKYPEIKLGTQRNNDNDKQFLLVYATERNREEKERTGSREGGESYYCSCLRNPAAESVSN